MSNTTPVSSRSPLGGSWSGGPSGPRGAWRTIHDSEGPCTGGVGHPSGAHTEPAGRGGKGGPSSETEEALDTDRQPRASADLAHGEQDARHERGPVVGVVAQGQGLPRCAHEDLLV